MFASTKHLVSWHQPTVTNHWVSVPSTNSGFSCKSFRDRAAKIQTEKKHPWSLRWNLKMIVSRKCMKMSSFSSWYFFWGGPCETSGVCLTVGAVIHSKSRYKNRVVKSLATINVHLRTLGYSNWVYKDPLLNYLFDFDLKVPVFHDTMIGWYICNELSNIIVNISSSSSQWAAIQMTSFGSKSNTCPAALMQNPPPSTICIIMKQQCHQTMVPLCSWHTVRGRRIS